MLKQIHEEEGFSSFQADMVPGSLFWFHVFPKETYDDGTSLWFLICEPASPDPDSGCMILGNVRGSREDAVQRLEEILKVPDIIRM